MTDEERHSQPLSPEPLPDFSPEERARLEAENTLRQYDRMVELIEDHTRRQAPFRLRVSVISELNRIALEGLTAEAGLFRQMPVEISKSEHSPPQPEQVPGLVDDACYYVNSHLQDTSPTHLAAYVMWRLNWIHPFSDGNGRTARAVSYYTLCSHLGFLLPGEETIPELIASNKSAYYAALDAADRAWVAGSLDLTQMESLLQDYLARQLVELHELATTTPSSEVEGGGGNVGDDAPERTRRPKLTWERATHELGKGVLPEALQLVLIVISIGALLVFVLGVLGITSEIPSAPLVTAITGLIALISRLIGSTRR